MRYKYLFGPVPSRRLGISLGVDLVPHKVCNLNCVYCEIGQTNNQTNERKEYLAYDKIIEELNHYLSEEPELDFITFSGAGEPTLHSRIGDIISYIKSKHSKYYIALITNGLLLFNSTVRDEIMQSDVILTSFDAASEEVFNKVNRPLDDTKVTTLIDGLIEFRKEYKGEIWLELFIVPGINDTKQELTKLKQVFNKIKPDKIQLNTLDRPGTEPWVTTPERSELENIKEFLSPLPNIEIVARFNQNKHIRSFDDDRIDIILSTIRRRPCTFDDLKEILDVGEDELKKYLSHLINNNKIQKDHQSEGVFYKLINDL